MPLSHTAISELRQRLEEIRQEQRELETRAAQLEGERKAIAVLLEGSTTRKSSGVHAEPPASFTDRVRCTVRLCGRDVSPSDVADAMMSRGWAKEHESDRSALVTAVSNTLHRLTNSKRADVTKVKRGVYRHANPIDQFFSDREMYPQN